MTIVKLAIILSFTLVNFRCFGETKFLPFIPKITQTESEFTDKTPPNIKITKDKINLPTKEVLTELIFFNRENFVFIGNKFTDENKRQRTFFKTSDGGKSWRDYKVEIPKDAGIDQLVFTNENNGWITLNNNGLGWEDSKLTWLMRTVDGGKTWNVTKTANKTTYSEIFFTDEKNGWLIGNEYSLEPTVTVKPLVYKTADGGESWVETSSQLRRLIGIDSGKAQIGNLLVRDANNIKVTNKYNIFESSDGGQNWHKYGIDFSFLRDQNAIGNMGFVGETNRVKAAQGGMTEEGRYVYLATEENNGNWVNREIKEPINLSNVYFPTEKDVFLFGEIQNGFSKEDWANKKVVIYYSADGGNTFSKIYQSDSSEFFSDIHRLAENKFFVVRKNGVMINIEF